MPLAVGWIAWVGLVALVLLAAGDAARPPAGAGGAIRSRSGATGASYTAQVVDLIERTRVVVADGDRLISQRDADPWLGTDPVWLGAHAGTVEALAAGYRRALELRPGAGDAELQSCLTESLRVLWTGHALMQSSFAADGHHAYHDSSHGNWDVDLGLRQLGSCENLARARS